MRIKPTSLEDFSHFALYSHERKDMLYDFHQDLKHYSKLRTPLSPAFVSFVQKPMHLLYALQHDDEHVHVTRTMAPLLKADVLESVSSNDKPIPGIGILIYEPKNCTEPLPCLYFVHGGGFVFNAAPHHFALARRFTKELGIKTVFVDYRLAPKHKFPIAHNDCLSVYEWLISNANSLKIDHQRIVVAGDSAGGNLATAVCLMAQERRLPMPKAQMLLYPVLDRRMQTQSYKLYTNTPMCNARDIKKYFGMYVGDLAAIPPALAPYLSPLETPSFEGMPQTYMETAQFDCLHDEGVQYAQALNDSEVPVELHETKGAMHGYDIARNSRFMDSIMAMRTAYLRKVFCI